MTPLSVLLKLDSPPPPLFSILGKKERKESGIQIQPSIKDSFIDPSQIKIQINYFKLTEVIFI